MIADIHSDAEALEDALEWARILRCNAVWCAGDIVGRSFVKHPEPERTVDILRSSPLPAICVGGNHDKGSRKWRPDTNAFLDALPDSFDGICVGVQLVMRHIPEHPYEPKPNAARAILISGHTHQAGRTLLDGLTLLRLGALFRPAFEDPPHRHRAFGVFGVLDLPTCRFSQRRVSDGGTVALATWDLRGTARGRMYREEMTMRAQ